MFEVRMPQWGMNMTEGTIVQWFKREGEQIEKGAPLVEIEIAKAIDTLSSPASGVIVKLVANVNDIIPVQGLLAIIEDS